MIPLALHEVTKWVRKPRFYCVVLLGVQQVLLWKIAIEWSPNPDELAHIAGGVAIWEYGRFDLYCVNPPLTKLIAALPVHEFSLEKDWLNLDYRIQTRPEFDRGFDFVDSHPGRWRTYLVCGRLLLASFAMLGGLICFQWATEIYGQKSGFIALILWCFSPNILTWNSVICSDGLATSIGVATGYFFWRWLKYPSWCHAFLAGVALGVSQLTKMTWIVLFPFWLFTWCIYHRKGFFCQNSVWKHTAQFIIIVSLGVCLLNIGYGFTGTFTKLHDYTFFSKVLTSPGSFSDTEEERENRFIHSFVANLPVPVPADYLRGIDLQKKDFEEGKQSYLFGKWSEHGWWYYYLVALFLKTPIGTIGLAFSAFALILIPVNRSQESSRLKDEIVLLSHAISLFTLISTQDGFSVHFRYVLPTFPFVFIWISQVGRLVSRYHPWLSVAIFSLILESVLSSLLVYPHSMSYFNLAVGARNGHNYLLGSSFSWSQDVFYLKECLNNCVKDDIPFVTLSTRIPLRELEIESRGVSPSSNPSSQDEALVGPVPGWHAVDVQLIHNHDLGYSYFLEFTPSAMIGYSIYIYHISLDDANRVRKMLGLSILDSQDVPQDKFISELVVNSRRQKIPCIAVYIECEDLSVLESLRVCLSNATVKPITSREIIDGQLNNFDLILFPGGRASEQSASLGPLGRAKLREYVHKGGGFLGICAGAFLASSTFDWELSIVNAESSHETRFVPGHGHQMLMNRGDGDVHVDLNATGCDILGFSHLNSSMYYAGGPIFKRGRRTYLCDYVILASYKSEVHRYSFQSGTMLGTPAIIAAPFGKGRVILFSSHPESMSELRPLIARAVLAVAK